MTKWSVKDGNWVWSGTRAWRTRDTRGSLEAVREVGDVVVAADVWMLVYFDPGMMAGVTADVAVVIRSCVRTVSPASASTVS